MQATLSHGTEILLNDNTWAIVEIIDGQAYGIDQDGGEHDLTSGHFDVIREPFDSAKAFGDILNRLDATVELVKASQFSAK